ncbi:glucans biosynthesis glucosyltransferase MdoH [Pseudodonghicola flavimaris]|uniref:Glucans biosynthesis glucosyltransferase H n=1 Tax=Pseudodonghicola flavimaris TaxID=3050036 RepID=A0ABT7F867_9RHOB|nr:glucans biosynthesis glucosyltransferase MdoH [Pseudodonghicola flavimaris]MDK3020812.1 glucans biosynthesis glucosyltransferase MdoH [Pseudodonghicola flavimaris]
MPGRHAADGATLAVRLFALSFAAAMGLGACWLILLASDTDGIDLVDMLRAALILITTAWLAWGAAQALIGLISRPPARRPDPDWRPSTRSVVLVPICNEDPVATFARIAAMDQSIAAAGLTPWVDFAVLSDSRDETVAARERFWFTRLLRDRDGQGRIFYRRRRSNEGRKAGNIEEFIRSSGGAYDFAVILDADSLMEAETIGEMIRRMEAEPDLGLLQTLPQIIGARSFFGRAMQFSAAFYAPVFARGLARMQGPTGPFWGHNAIVRMRAFAESCGMPELSGPPPFGGSVLSHDYVEAALLARAGWLVRVDDDLRGSYEEGPENLVAFARRDRRWCQGNLQHSRLVTAPGLRGWSRFVFLQGILSYLSAPFWGAFLIVSVLAVLTPHRPNYFPMPYQLFPVFPDDRTKEVVGLAIGIVGLLVLPKLLIWLQAARNGRALRFGGAGQALRSFLTELLLSALMAPLMLMYQSRAVLQVLAGRDGGWPANQRGEGRLSWTEAWAAGGWIALFGATGLVALFFFLPGMLGWLAPVFVPMVMAVPIIALASRPLAPPLFTTPTEAEPTPVIRASAAIQERWGAMEPAEEPGIAAQAVG